MSEIKVVTDWIDTARQKPSVRNVANYLAYTMSELAECFAAIPYFEDVQKYMENISQELRSGALDLILTDADRTELLDGAIDTAWCAIGLAHMLGDAKGAFDEVGRSNWSKFQNGIATLDSTGKVVKAEGYFAPNLKGFLR